MPTIVYSDGTRINFSGNPTPEQVESAYKQAKGIIPPETPQPERNIAQKALGAFVDPLANLAVRGGQAVADVALTGINKLTGGALNKYTPEGDLSAALQRAENTTYRVPLVGTEIKPVSSLTAKNVAGNAIGTVALGVPNPLLAGALIGGGAAAAEDKSGTEIALNTAVGAAAGKILQVGFNAAAPYIERVALRFGQPALDRLAGYIPESAKGFVENLSNKISRGAPDIASKNILPESIETPLERGINIIDQAERNVSRAIGNKITSLKDFVTNKIGNKTAEQILAVPEKDIGKLTAKQQKFWYSNQARTAREVATESARKAEVASEQDILKAKNDINNFQQELGNVSREKAIALKEPSRQLMKDMSNRYVELTGEAAEGSPALNRTIASDKLNAAIDSKFEYNPDIANSLKQDLGISDIEKLSNQDILNKAREIMRGVSKTAKAGNKTYTPQEYQAIQKYSFLMEQLNSNGVDLTEANKLWREWVPVRDRIIREVRPFDEGNVGKIPLVSTLQRSEAVTRTAPQANLKLDAKNFISELETRLNLPKNSIGAEIKKAVENVEQAKLRKIDIEQAAKEIKSMIKTERDATIKKIGIKRYNTVSAAEKREEITKTIKRWLVRVGIGIPGAIVGKKILDEF